MSRSRWRRELRNRPSATPWIVWAASIAIAAFGVAVARRHVRRHRDLPDLPLAPALLLAGDLAIVVLVAAQRPPSPIALAAGLALAGAVYGLTSAGAWQWVGLVALAIADALVLLYARDQHGAVPSAALALLPLAATLAAILLTRIADRRHEANVK